MVGSLRELAAHLDVTRGGAILDQVLAAVPPLRSEPDDLGADPSVTASINRLIN